MNQIKYSLAKTLSINLALKIKIYFPPPAHQSFNNCFNLCLYNLFKLKPEATPEDEVRNEEK